MASELTIDYTLSYKVSVDMDKMLAEYDWLRDEFDDDSEWEGWVKDSIMANLEDWEELKLFGRSLPHYVTHFSVEEHLTDHGGDDTV